MANEYKVLHAIADEETPKVSFNIIKGFEAFKDDVSLNNLAAAIEGRNAKKALAALDMTEFADMPEIRGIYQDVVERSALKHIETSFPAVLRPDIRFDTTNKGIIKWIDKNTAELVTNLSKESAKATKDAIRKMVKASFDEGLPPRKAAELVRNSIGLNVQQEKAVFNARRGMIDQGFSPGQIEKRINALIEQKIDERAMLIARTETIKAVNAGQQEVWNQANEQGLIPKGTKKEWIVTPDDLVCPICNDPRVNGQQVPYNEDFTIWTPLGVIRIPFPPAHPRCRCATKLLFK